MRTLEQKMNVAREKGKLFGMERTNTTSPLILEVAMSGRGLKNEHVFSKCILINLKLSRKLVIEVDQGRRLILKRLHEIYLQSNPFSLSFNCHKRTLNWKGKRCTCLQGYGVISPALMVF